MQKKILFAIALLITVQIIPVACSKGENEAPANKSRSELISKAPWKFSNATVGGSSVSAFLQACQKDNILTFVATGTGTADEGFSKCNSADPQTNPFTWNFQTNETILFVSTPLFAGGSSTFSIESLTETELVVSQNMTISGSTQHVVVSFIH